MRVKGIRLRASRHGAAQGKPLLLSTGFWNEWACESRVVAAFGLLGWLLARREDEPLRRRIEEMKYGRLR